MTEISPHLVKKKVTDLQAQKDYWICRNNKDEPKTQCQEENPSENTFTL